MRRILCIPVLLSVLLLASCATQKRSDTLTDTLQAYSSTLRWGDFQSAQMFLEPKYRAAHPLSKLDLERYKQVRVSGYDDGSGPVPAGKDDVQQTVHIGLINNNTMGEYVARRIQSVTRDVPSTDFGPFGGETFRHRKPNA